MSLKSSLQQTFYKQALKRRVQRAALKRVPMNMSKASSIAILIDISAGSDTIINKAAFSFAASLRKLGKEVSIFAFIAEPKVPEGLDFDCFCKKDLNWALVPKGPKVEAFLAKPYDILFGLFLTGSKALDYIIQVAKTQLNVGYYEPDRTHLYDLMVHNSEQDIEKAMKQMQDTLLRINK